MRKINSRIGSGFDVHKFTAEKDFIMLGGVKIPHSLGLEGHSDADVLLHALVDAILGALGKGDIGEFFPPSEEKWRGADSAIFLAEAQNQMISIGYEIGNIDATIIAEAPKITPHKAAIRANIARLLNLEESQVNIKATTTEGLGFTGRREGIACTATVLITAFD